MPFYKSIAITPETTAYFWKNSEDLESLVDAVSLTNTSKLRLKKMNAVSQKKGFLGIRMLLEHIGYSDFDLVYDESGKPYFKGNSDVPNTQYISISHSHEFSSICISNEEVGIDIELLKEKTLKIASRFMDINHLKGLSKKDQITKATIIWGVKEAIFKIKNEKGISFPKHIFEDNFKLTDKNCIATLNFNKKIERFKIKYYTIEDYIFVCALKE